MQTPFARAAEGARLPDGNPNTTVTFALTRKVNITTDASGELDVLVLPNLQTAALTTRGSVGVANLSLASVVTTVNTLNLPTTKAGKLGLGFPCTDLSDQYTKFRIVAYGARLRMASGVNTTGEFTVAVMPLKGLVPPLDTGKPYLLDWNGDSQPFYAYEAGVGPRNTLNAYLDSLGVPYTGGADANEGKIWLERLTNIPSHASASASEVAARGMHLRGLPFENYVREYKSMAFKAVGLDCADGGFFVGNSTTQAANLASQQLGTDMSCWRVGGHESLLIGGSSFPASSTIGTLELIYHVEAIPNPSYALLARPTGTLPSVPPSLTLDSVLTKLHRMPRISFADIVTQAGDSMMGDIEGRAEGAAARGLGSLAGTLARLAIAAV